jgi:RNA polymerase sigma-70 factor (ECF subfamily)
MEGPADACEAADPEADAEWAAPAAADARLRAMVDRHFDPVWRTLRRLGVLPTELDDCAQQVFVIASRKLASIEQGRERGFLLRAAVNVAAHACRSRRRRREVPEPEEEGGYPADPALGPDEIIDRKRLLVLLDEILAALPEDLRAVLVLYEIEELSTQEIAALLELPAGTVASRLRRAREAFARVAARVAGGRS